MSKFKYLVAASCVLATGPACVNAAGTTVDSGQTQISGETMGAQERFDQVYDLAPGAEISVEGIAGPVTVETGSGDRAEVHILRQARSQRELDCYRTSVEASPSRLRIEHDQDRTPACRSIHSRQEVRLVLPRSANLSLESIAGRVAIAPLDGHVRLESIAGHVTLSQVRSASLSSIAGGLHVNVDQLAPRGVDISSVVGGVELAFGSNANADLAVSSVMGRVRSESPSVQIYGEDSSYRARIGSGGPNLNVSSIVGGVKLRSY
jgi:hypothetical protein